jgi:hypothetical protein
LAPRSWLMRAVSSASGVGGGTGRLFVSDGSGSARLGAPAGSIDRRPSIARAVGKPQTVQCEPVAEIGCSQIGQLDGTDTFQTQLETVSTGLKSIRSEIASSYPVPTRAPDPIWRLPIPPKDSPPGEGRHDDELDHRVDRKVERNGRSVDQDGRPLRGQSDPADRLSNERPRRYLDAVKVGTSGAGDLDLDR